MLSNVNIEAAEKYNWTAVNSGIVSGRKMSLSEFYSAVEGIE